MNRMARYVTLGALATAAAGCTSMAGVGGAGEYSCKAPEGVKCDSVAGTYANALGNHLPSQRPGATAPQEGARPMRIESTAAQAGAIGATTVTPAAVRRVVSSLSADERAMPLRSSPRVLRLWVKAWEDADGDLVDQLYVYVPVDAGRWLIDHAPRAVRDVYEPIRAPRTVSPEGGVEPQAPSREASSVAPSALEQRLQAARGVSAITAPRGGASDAK